MKNKYSLFITDTHLSENTIDINMSVFEQAKDKALSLGLKVIYHAGDIFESRKAQSLDVLKAFEEILDMLHENNIMLKVIPGNHDKTSYTSHHSFLDAFKHHPAIHIFQTPKIENLSDNFDIVFLPYFDERKVYFQMLLDANSLIGDKKAILLTHVAVNGVKNNDGSIVENLLKSDMFSKYEIVLVGHYHDRTQVGNVLYFGSTYQKHFGENNNKGCLLFTDTGDGKFVTDFIQFNFPEYKKITIDLNKKSPVEINNLLETYKNNNNNIRFEFKGTKEQVNSIDKNKFKREGIDVKLKSSEIEIGIQEAENNDFVSFDKEEITKEFEVFCKKNSIRNVKKGQEYLIKILNDE